MVAIVLSVAPTSAPALSAFLVEKAGVTALDIPQGMMRVPVKPTGAYYVKVLTVLLKEVYVHLNVKVEYGYVVEKAKFLSYHVFFSSISNIRCSSFECGRQVENKIRELVTPVLGAEITPTTPLIFPTKKSAAPCARSRYLEATNASTAHQRPMIPWTKRESRWGPRYVLRKPAEPFASSWEEAAPVAAEEEEPYVAPQEGNSATVVAVETSMGSAPSDENAAASCEVVLAASKPSEMTPEESSKETPKESISTSPEKGQSLLPKEEKTEAENAEECFVSLEEASNPRFQTDMKGAMNDFLSSLRGQEFGGEIDREYEREMLMQREEIYIRPSVRE